MRWASALVLSAGLGLLQFPELKSDFSNSNEEQRTEGRKNRFIFRGILRRLLLLYLTENVSMVSQAP